MLINFVHNCNFIKFGGSCVDNGKKYQYNSPASRTNGCDVFIRNANQGKTAMDNRQASFEEIQEKIKEKIREKIREIIVGIGPEEYEVCFESIENLSDDEYMKEIKFVDPDGNLREVHKYMGDQLCEVALHDVVGYEIANCSVIYPEFNETEVVIMSEKYADDTTDVVKFSGVDLSDIND